MKKHWIFAVIIFPLLAGACTPKPVSGQDKPAPSEGQALATADVNPPAPAVENSNLEQGMVTQSPVNADQPQDDWANVSASGILRVGTSADYPPFAYYNESGQLDGFDIALAREVARRLGVAADIHNFAFQGLPTTLMIRQVDVVFAALSVNNSRQQQIDFSNSYYMGMDGWLAKKDSAINTVQSLDQLGGNRVAVQRGSVYEDWMMLNLVDTGRLSSDQVFVYDKAYNAVNDLREGKVDLVMMDLVPAQSTASDGTVKLVGSGLFVQNYAAGLPKGSNLTIRINQALQEMAADGTMGTYIKQYLDIQVPQQPAAQVPTATTPKPAECTNAMQYVKDLNYDDQNMSKPPVFNPGDKFTKGWRIKNIGTCTWTSSYFLAFSYGNVPTAQMSGKPVSLPGSVAPGQEVDVNVNLTAPADGGTYQGFWNIYTNQSVPFGNTIWAGIKVKGQEPPVGAPNVVSFAFDPGTINVNNCATVYWNVKGTYDYVRLYDEKQKLVWDKAPAKGNYKVCASQAGKLTYLIEAKGPGGKDFSEAKLLVKQPTPSNPVINQFRAKPGEVTIPSCAILQWNVSDASEIGLMRDGVQILRKQPAAGTYQFCPTEPNEYTFILVARNSSGVEESASVVVMINPPVPEPR